MGGFFLGYKVKCQTNISKNPLKNYPGWSNSYWFVVKTDIKVKYTAKHYLYLLMTVKINSCMLRIYRYFYFCCNFSFCCNHMQYLKIA